MNEFSDFDNCPQVQPALGRRLREDAPPAFGSPSSPVRLTAAIATGVPGLSFMRGRGRAVVGSEEIAVLKATWRGGMSTIILCFLDGGRCIVGEEGTSFS